jgi:hypothetical protein
MAVIGFGGWGIWFEWSKLGQSSSQDLSPLLTALITFFSAVIASSAMQLIYQGFDKGDKVVGGVGAVALAVLLAIAGSLLSGGSSDPVKSIHTSVICSAFSVWVWIMANCDDPLFKSKPRVDAPIGGSVDAQVVGSVDGISS